MSDVLCQMSKNVKNFRAEGGLVSDRAVHLIGF